MAKNDLLQNITDEQLQSVIHELKEFTRGFIIKVNSFLDSSLDKI